MNESEENKNSRAAQPNVNISHLPYSLDLIDERHAFFETHWKKVGLRLLKKHCDVQDKTVLDYGTGRGEMMNLCKKEGMVVTGADMDSECIEMASKYGDVVELTGERPLATSKEKSFDIVVSFHVLEHVPNPREVLADLATIAREYVVIAVPNLRKLEWLCKREIHLSDVNNGHLQSWDHWHLLNLAENHCGLRLVEWGFDATKLPFFSPLVHKMFGTKAVLSLETGLFRRMFPFHGVSVLGLFRPIQSKT